MNCKTNRKYVLSSLFAQSLNKVVDNLDRYSIEDIEVLPCHIKNRILKKILSTKYFTGNSNFTKHFNVILNALVHKDVVKLNFSSIQVCDEILSIVSRCENLKRITLDTGTFTKNGLVNLFKHLKNLYVITIVNSLVCDNEVLSNIALNCPLLTSLDVSGCSNINDSGISSLAILTHLKWVSFSRTKAGHDGISKFVDGKSGNNLLELRIDNCVNVTDATLRKIVDCCRKLQILLFYNCGPTTTKVETLSSFEDKQLKNLKQITWTINW